VGSGSWYSITPPEVNTGWWVAGGDVDAGTGEWEDDLTAGPFAVQPTARRRRIPSAARISGETWRRPWNYAPSTLSAPMAVDLDRIGRASLKELGDIRIDDVLSFIDRGIENMPSYMDLYRRWESQQWKVADLDFTLDREDWLKATDLERKSTLWSHRLFFNGEERVTATLAPFVWAAPTPEIEIFLSTQMVDEARHTVFFQRWWHDVVGTEAKDLGQLLAEIRPEANEGYNTLFYDRLPSAAQRLASNPKDFDAFVEGITIYHIIVEATIALTGQRFELESMRELGSTDRGFYRGFTAVARDESRHVSFGIKVLQEAVRENPERFAPLIQKTLVECLPLVSGTLDPPDPRYITEFGHTESEILQFAFESLNKRLRAIGINLAA
jgi:ribonucleoside-diphosphate reductase beta chain